MASSRFVIITLSTCLLACSVDTAPASEKTQSAGGQRVATAGAGGAKAAQDPVVNSGSQTEAPNSPQIAVTTSSAPDKLSVHVENASKLEVQIVTIQCNETCADVTAVATGGNPPYAFQWNDQVTTASREICGDAAEFSVTVTDTPLKTVEFAQAGQTSTSTVTTKQSACPVDGGTPVDGGPPETGDDTGFCIKNPSFEGAQFPGVPPEWTFCQNTPDINPGLSTYMASDGETYIGLGAGMSAEGTETAEANLCRPLKAGEAMPFSVDLSVSAAFGPFGGGYIEIWGAATSCGRDELLWTSPFLDQFDMWKTYCGTLMPSNDYPFLAIVPTLRSSVEPQGMTAVTGYLIIDNFGSSGACTNADQQ